MVKTYITIKVEKRDYDALKGRIKDKFVRAHPQLKGMNITTSFLFCQAVALMDEMLDKGARIK